MARSRRRWLWLLVPVAVAVGVAVAVYGSDAPDVVDAERALQQERDAQPSVEETGSEPDEPTEPEPTTELTGRWVVDRDRPFDGLAGMGTFVGYRIDEELSGIGANTAVGRTPEVDGEVHIEATRVLAAEVTADLTGLVSDDARRDRRVASMLGDGATARFVLDDELELGEIPPVGEVIELTGGGTLTIRDVSREVDVVLQAVIADHGLVVTGTAVIRLEDFDVEVPSAAIVLSAADEATIEWQLFLERG